MPPSMSLANQLLVASPSLDNTEFSHSVIYICEHHEQGTVGLIINRPMKYSLGLVFNQLDINPIDQEKNQLPLLYGGPNQSERGFVMHRPKGLWHSSLDLLPNDVTITTSNDIIRAIAEDRGPKDALVVLGYVGWAENQLESEIINDSWLVCPFKSEILYQEPFETRWEAAGMSMGINMNQLVAGAGHA